MASIISAGTTSATALNMSADTSGVLQLASNNGTVALTVATTQYIGIGTATPYVPLQVTGTIKVATGNAQGILSLGDGGGSTTNCGIYRGSAGAPTTDGNYLNIGGYDGVIITTGAAAIASQTERMRIDASGNTIFGSTGTVDSARVQIFGAKTLSSGIPQQQLNIADTSAIAAGVGGAVAFSALYSGGSYTTMGSVEGVRENATSGNYAGALVFKTRTNGSDNGERARITSGGQLVVGSTVSHGGNIESVSSYFRAYDGNSSQGTGYVASDGAGNEWHFGRSTSNGYYYVVRQTGTGMYMNTNSWVATSDLRAKENISPIENSLSKIIALNPVRFTFKKDGMEDVGFIAQEMYEHIPDVVDKPKDEEEMMGIAKEKLIPYLVKAIQELNAKVTSLEEQVLNLGVK